VPHAQPDQLRATLQCVGDGQGSLARIEEIDQQALPFTHKSD